MDSEIITYQFNPMHKTNEKVVKEKKKYNKYLSIFLCCCY